eukprot:scaffold37740_cov156-Skeletonema_marinoi.AAC.1
MAWGARYRRSEDDGFYCGMCSDWTEYDGDIGECSCCGNTFCSDCVAIECTGCKENNPDDSYQICESCLPYPGCEACNDEDITFCNACIEGHLQNCTKSSRSERIINSESHSIEENERKVKRLQEEITYKQAELSRLESMVAASKERKEQAEKELKNEREGEGEQPSKKQKT